MTQQPIPTKIATPYNVLGNEIITDLNVRKSDWPAMDMQVLLEMLAESSGVCSLANG